MIPLIVAGAASIAGSVVDAWKAHAETLATSQAVKSADFQGALKTAATQLAAAADAQKTQSLPSDIQSVARQILQSPEVQSMVNASPTGSMNLQFNSNGQLFASRAGGGLRQINLSPELQQQLQQLNSALRSPAAASYGGVARSQGEIAANHLPVQLSLAAI